MGNEMSVYSLSISAEAVLDMHSLNNEGGEGNQIQTRMVNIVDQQGRLHNVNAVSGDMFKHIQAEHFFRISQDCALKLCKGCVQFNANRISADDNFGKAIEGKTDAYALDYMLEECALDDVAGNLITAGNRSIPRKSVVEFGWVVALPEASSTESYFHVKYVREHSAEQRDADAQAAARSANLGQNIFHRPASSGIYALVSTVEIARIGFNDITQRYPISDAQREARYKALLESLLYTFVQPNGAMRSTQHPHIVDVRGVIASSAQVVPAPTMSPLNGEYQQIIAGIATELNKLRPGAVTLYPFKSLAEFAQVMTKLIQTTKPYKLSYAS